MQLFIYLSICLFYLSIWSNYSDLTRPHPKWWLSKGNPLISGKSGLVKYYYNLARSIYTTSSWIFPLHTLSVSPLAKTYDIEALDVKAERCDMVLEAVAGGLNNRGWGDHQLEWENGDDENGIYFHWWLKYAGK